MKNRFLPVSKEDMKERKIEQLDFVYVTRRCLCGSSFLRTGDYQPASGVERAYRVGMIPQPDWKTEESVDGTWESRDLGFW